MLHVTDVISLVTDVMLHVRNVMLHFTDTALCSLSDVACHIYDVIGYISVMLRVTQVNVYVKSDIQHFTSYTHSTQPCTKNMQYACIEF